jgi:hypothetical protein
MNWREELEKAGRDYFDSCICHPDHSESFNAGANWARGYFRRIVEGIEKEREYAEAKDKKIREVLNYAAEFRDYKIICVLLERDDYLKEDK